MENKEINYKAIKRHQDVISNIKTLSFVLYDDTVNNETVATTVKELSEKLKEYPEDALVILTGDIDYTSTQYGYDTRCIEIIEIAQESEAEYIERQARINQKKEEKKNAEITKTDQISQLKSRLSQEDIDLIKNNKFQFGIYS